MDLVITAQMLLFFSCWCKFAFEYFWPAYSSHDIASNYKPKEIMLSGEPYLIDYLNNIDNFLKNFKKIIIVPDHVHLWELNI